MRESLNKSVKLFSIKQVYKYNFIFCIVMLLVFLIGSGIQAYNKMQNISKTTTYAAKTQIEYRISRSIQLLEALAIQEQYYNMSIPAMDKVRTLDQINKYFGYMMIRYVDKDINVYSINGATSLASRDYMQRLFTTGNMQITDSFIAGADGVTLNYTIAVPMYQNGNIAGCLFCVIYFDEIQALLNGAVRQNGIEVTLLGSKKQMMSTTKMLRYGDNYIDYIGKFHLIGITKNQLETGMLSNKPGNFKVLDGWKLFDVAYANVGKTSWSIIAVTSFWDVYYSQLMGDLPIIIIFITFLLLLTWMSGRYIQSQRKNVDSLVQAVQALEQKIYMDEKPDNIDFHEVLQLTSDGLIDGLTGVATRTVFINQIQAHLRKLSDDSVAALCFIDLDDLKILNDTYGHEAGDIGLKSIGYVLREYEKKYDGLVGRYGGDEFILLMSNLKDVNELQCVLEELSVRLQFALKEFGDDVFVHCSIGVALWRRDAELDHLISEADKALYSVKQSGKNNFKIAGSEGDK